MSSFSQIIIDSFKQNYAEFYKNNKNFDYSIVVIDLTKDDSTLTITDDDERTITDDERTITDDDRTITDVDE